MTSPDGLLYDPTPPTWEPGDSTQIVLAEGERITTEAIIVLAAVLWAVPIAAGRWLWRRR